MNAKREKQRPGLTTVDKVLLGLMAILSVALIAVGILQRCGLSLINGTLMLYLPVLAVLVLLGWLGYRLIRKIRNRTVRIVVSSVVVLVLALGLTLVLSYMGLMAALTVPQRYATLASPSGARKVVVMRQVDTEQERLDARRSARLAADPDGDPEYTVQDWGYVYRAYPRVLNVFYRSNADVEGEVYLANDVAAADDGAQETALPHGTLMVEWLEDEAGVHFYVENPGAGEGGECTLRF